MSTGAYVLILFVCQVWILLWYAHHQRVESNFFGENKQQSIIKMLKEYLGYAVNVKTDAGDVAGYLIHVDKEYIRIVKADNEIVMVPLTSLNGIIQEGTKKVKVNDFEDHLERYLGKEIEVFYINELVQGKLMKVKDGYFTVKIKHPGYSDSGKLMNILNESVEYILIPKP